MSKEDRLKWIYSSKDNQELAERYDQWANDYDQELEDDYDWQIPQLMADTLTHYTPSSGRILDAGVREGDPARRLPHRSSALLRDAPVAQGPLHHGRRPDQHQGASHKP